MICETGFITKGMDEAKVILENNYKDKIWTYPDHLKDNANYPLFYAVNEKDKDLAAFFYWREKDKNYVIDITKRLMDGTAYYIRLYRDFSGYVVFVNKDKIETTEYFKVSGENGHKLANMIRSEVDRITANPVPAGGNKEWQPYQSMAVLPIHLKYNIPLLSPSKTLLKMWKYEDTIYGDFEKEIPVVNELLIMIDKEDSLRIPVPVKAEQIFDEILAEEEEIAEEIFEGNDINADNSEYMKDPDEEEYDNE